ncbi:hypothetical protein RJ641_010769 [Dillenia turbinata]|uniref:Uncharacterized protein n=1 Tax=Dillenia turbinata TaxID=194707 RepID=A0AAN8Z301_9MAGN
MVDPKYIASNNISSQSMCNKQPMMTAKKTALRDVQNDNRILPPKLFGSSPLLKETESVLGAKRPNTHCPISPPHHQSACNNTGNGHLVYVRRKSEAEGGKSSGSENDRSSDYPQLRQLSNNGDMVRRQHQVKDPKIAGLAAMAQAPLASLLASSRTPLPASLGKQGNLLSPGFKSFPFSENSQGRSGLHWRERFINLQAYLKNYDYLSQEAYIQMLRSLSSIERSRHAVDLEKRAIHLLLEEGREIQRMKVLNVLGKSAPQSSPSASPKAQQPKPDTFRIA